MSLTFMVEVAVDRTAHNMYKCEYVVPSLIAFGFENAVERYNTTTDDPIQQYDKIKITNETPYWAARSIIILTLVFLLGYWLG